MVLKVFSIFTEKCPVKIFPQSGIQAVGCFYQFFNRQIFEFRRTNDINSPLIQHELIGPIYSLNSVLQ